MNQLYAVRINNLPKGHKTEPPVRFDLAELHLSSLPHTSPASFLWDMGKNADPDQNASDQGVHFFASECLIKM